MKGNDKIYFLKTEFNLFITTVTVEAKIRKDSV